MKTLPRAIGTLPVFGKLQIRMWSFSGTTQLRALARSAEHRRYFLEKTENCPKVYFGINRFTAVDLASSMSERFFFGSVLKFDSNYSRRSVNGVISPKLDLMVCPIRAGFARLGARPELSCNQQP